MVAQLSLNKEPEKLEAFDDCCAYENAFEDDYMGFSRPQLVGAAVRKVFSSTIQGAVAHLILIVLPAPRFNWQHGRGNVRHHFSLF